MFGNRARKESVWKSPDVRGNTSSTSTSLMFQKSRKLSQIPECGNAGLSLSGLHGPRQPPCVLSTDDISPQSLFRLSERFSSPPRGRRPCPPLADPVCEDIDPLDIDGVPEFCARSPPPPVVEDLPLPVQVNVEGEGIVIGRQWTGVGRPPNSFFVSAPARLELLLDLQIKHRLSGDGLSSSCTEGPLLCRLYPSTSRVP